MPEKDKEYYESIAMLEPNVGHCKRCIHRSSCGNKNKKEASWCEKYRPEMRRGKRR